MDVFAVLSEKALLFLVQTADLANGDCHGVPSFLFEEFH
jgi:hypothetical protein